MMLTPFRLPSGKVGVKNSLVISSIVVIVTVSVVLCCVVLCCVVLCCKSRQFSHLPRCELLVSHLHNHSLSTVITDE